MPKGLLNGKKAIKMAVLNKGITQRELASLLNKEETVFNMRLSRGYYDKPGNLARLADVMGMRLELKIECKLIDNETGNIIAVDVNKEELEEE